MTSPKNPTASKWAAASLLALATLTSCASRSHGSFPAGSFPAGSFPAGSFQTDSFPTGSFPTGAPDSTNPAAQQIASRAALHFANRATLQPTASTGLPASAETAPPTAFLPGDFAAKSTFQEAAANRQPRGMAYVRTAFGMEQIEVLSGTNFKNDTNAAMLEVGFEGMGKLIGGGLRFGGRATDDDLLESSSAVDTSGQGAHFFGHFTIRPGSGRFRMPIRIGPEILANSVVLNASPFGTIAELDFVSFGGAIEIEPEFDIFRSSRSAFSIYGRAHVGAGIALVSSDTTDFDTDATNFGVEVGARWQLAKFLLSGGYMLHRTEYGQSDPENFAIIEETQWQFEGFFLTLGVRW